jgi:endonuclease/exonuclease/phosphatase family metal-dependent hydrolase
MSWNIHKGVGGFDRRYDLERTIEVIRHYAPDIVLLQEVAQAIPALRNDDQAEILPRALGMHAVFRAEHRRRTGTYGNLILSRFPLSQLHHLDLTIGWRKRRGLIQAHVRTHIGGHQRSLVVHAVHLGLAGSERHQQLHRFVHSPLCAHLSPHTPTIVGGDFNDLWGTLGTRHLLPIGFERAGNLVNTFPSALPLRPLDALFYRGNLRLVHSAIGRANLARMASDHRPIYADFVLEP